MSLSAAAASVIAAGVAAASSAASSVVNNRGGHRSQWRAFKYNADLQQRQAAYQKEAAEIGWQRQLEAWNMENEYNSPSAQMQRYQDAGLNPNLIYGQSNTAGSIGNYQLDTPDAPYADPDGAYSTGSHTGDAIAAAGSAIANGLASYQQAKKLDIDNQIAFELLKQNEQKTTQMGYQTAILRKELADYDNKIFHENWKRQNEKHRQEQADEKHGFDIAISQANLDRLKFQLQTMKDEAQIKLDLLRQQLQAAKNNNARFKLQQEIDDLRKQTMAFQLNLLKENAEAGVAKRLKSWIDKLENGEEGPDSFDLMRFLVDAFGEGIQLLLKLK